MAGRTRLTTVEHVQRVALDLFDEYGFEAVTIEEIAAAAGISGRSFFRYFASKADIPWGDAASVFAEMEERLAVVCGDVPLFEAVREAVVGSNAMHSEGLHAHRRRMSVIHRSPSLQTQRALRSAEQQVVIARFAARRLGEPAESLRPQVLAQVCLAAEIAAYDQWLTNDSADLFALIADAFATIELGSSRTMGVPLPPPVPAPQA